MSSADHQIAVALSRIADIAERVGNRAIAVIDRLEKNMERAEKREARWEAEDRERATRQNGEPTG